MCTIHAYVSIYASIYDIASEGFRARFEILNVLAQFRRLLFSAKSMPAVWIVEIEINLMSLIM